MRSEIGAIVCILRFIRDKYLRMKYKSKRKWDLRPFWYSIALYDIFRSRTERLVWRQVLTTLVLFHAIQMSENETKENQKINKIKSIDDQ